MLDFVFYKDENNVDYFYSYAKDLDLKLAFVFDFRDMNESKYAFKKNVFFENVRKKILQKSPIALLVDDIPRRNLSSMFDFLLFDASKEPRKLAETKQPAIMINLELNTKKDSIVNINSGMNHVIAKIMSDNNKIYGINISNLFNNNDFDIIIRRISQNIKLCRKYKVPFVVMTLAREPILLRNSNDLRSFISLFPVDPSDAKKAITFFDRWF